MASALPTRLGKYQVLRRVASGPMVNVYKARLDGIAGFSRTFAIKHVTEDVAGNQEAVARFEEEARRAARLAHSNIVQVLDLGKAQDRLFLVLEWVEGWSLARVLEECAETQAEMPVAHAVWVAMQVLNGLSYAHTPPERTLAEPLVHDALSAGNVLVSRDGEVKVSDFGLGRASHALRDAADAPYVAPERRDGSSGREASDVYAAGVLLYTCLAGTTPFASPDAAAAGEVTPVSEARPDVPEDLAVAVHAALAADPAQRHASAQVFRDALADVLPQVQEVFTQEDLASWVQELIGEDIVPDDVPPAVHGDLDDDLLEADEPLPRVATPEHDDRTAPAVDNAALPTPDDDAHTEVGGILADVAESKTAPWNEGGQSVVSPDIAAKVAGLKTNAPEPENTEIIKVTARSMGDVDLRDPLELAKGMWVKGALVAGLAGLAGAVMGAAFGMYGTAPQAYMSLPPVLEVHAPEGATVTINGTPYTTPAALAADTPHDVHVAIPGSTPIDVQLTLQAAEHRVLHIEAAEVPAEASEPE